MNFPTINLCESLALRIPQVSQKRILSKGRREFSRPAEEAYVGRPHSRTAGSPAVYSIATRPILLPRANGQDRGSNFTSGWALVRLRTGEPGGELRPEVGRIFLH
jgi:hypothetical protein